LNRLKQIFRLRGTFNFQLRRSRNPPEHVPFIDTYSTETLNFDMYALITKVRFRAA